MKNTTKQKKTQTTRHNIVIATLTLHAANQTIAVNLRLPKCGYLTKKLGLAEVFNSIFQL